MTLRNVGGDSYMLGYDAENRVRQVQKNGAVTASFGTMGTASW